MGFLRVVPISAHRPEMKKRLIGHDDIEGTASVTVLA